jgi:hypothetical protein
MIPKSGNRFSGKIMLNSKIQRLKLDRAAANGMLRLAF